MKGDSIRIVLVAKEEAERSFFGKHFAAYEKVILEEYPTLEDFRAQSPGKAYSGLVIDIRTLIRATAREKLFFSSLLDALPVIRVTRRPNSDSFSGLVESKDLGRGLSGKQILEAFINNLCREHIPCGVSSGEEQTTYLSAYLYFTADFEKERPIKATITDVSEEGCFVITSHECGSESTLSVVITVIKDSTPIPCQVRWVRPWKTDSRYLPGFGVSFERFEKNQLEELFDFLKK